MWAKDLLKIAKVYCGWSIIAFTVNSFLYFQGSDLDQSSSSRRADSPSEGPAWDYRRGEVNQRACSSSRRAYSSTETISVVKWTRELPSERYHTMLLT